MCGRFATTLPSDAMARLFEAAPDNDLPPIPNFNVCPTVDIQVVRGGDGAPGQRRLVAMRWGFLPHWYSKPADGPLLINARAETIAEKPAFRAACRARRCLVPADGFYEWNRDGSQKVPYFIRRRDGGPLVMAGIWQEWQRNDERLVTCALVTTAANATLRPIHHRMPVIVEPQDWALWLGEAGKGAALLMRPAADDLLESWRVSSDVNSNRADGPALMEPIA